MVDEIKHGIWFNNVKNYVAWFLNSDDMFCITWHKFVLGRKPEPLTQLQTCGNFENWLIKRSIDSILLTNQRMPGDYSLTIDYYYFVFSNEISLSLDKEKLYTYYIRMGQFKWVSWQPTHGPWLRQNCSRLLGVQSSFIAVQTPERFFFFFFGLKKQI